MYLLKKTKSITTQKMKFSMKVFFFSKYDQIRRIWSHLLKKSLMENLIFCAMNTTTITQLEKVNWAHNQHLQPYSSGK